MRCSHCGSDELVPVVHGSPNAIAWQAMLRGKIHLGGSFTSDGRRWHCANCSEEQLANDPTEHAKIIALAFETAGDEFASQPVKSLDAMMGRGAAQRTLFEFGSLGASSVKIIEGSEVNDVFALIDGKWETFDWPLAKYLPQMIEANRAGQVRQHVRIGDAIWKVTVTEINDGKWGLCLDLSQLSEGEH